MKTLRVILLSVLVYLFIITAVSVMASRCSEQNNLLIGGAPGWVPPALDASSPAPGPLTRRS